MRLIEILFRNLRSLPLVTRLIGIPVAVAILIAAGRSLQEQPLWMALVAVALAILFFSVSAPKLPRNRVLIALAAFSFLLPFILTYVALYGITEPATVRRWIIANVPPIRAWALRPA